MAAVMFFLCQFSRSHTHARTIARAQHLRPFIIKPFENIFHCYNGDSSFDGAVVNSAPPPPLFVIANEGGGLSWYLDAGFYSHYSHIYVHFNTFFFIYYIQFSNHYHYFASFSCLLLRKKPHRQPTHTHHENCDEMLEMCRRFSQNCTHVLQYREQAKI